MCTYQVYHLTPCAYLSWLAWKTHSKFAVLKMENDFIDSYFYKSDRTRTGQDFLDRGCAHIKCTTYPRVLISLRWPGKRTQSLQF
jgi:hypothetical protein